MILLFGEKVNPELLRVITFHHHPEILTEEDVQKGYLVESVPVVPEYISGKRAILYLNISTSEVWYEYEDIPKTPEQLLEERLSATEIAIANMLGV